MVWGGLEVVWGGLGCFGVVWGVSTDPIKHFADATGDYLRVQCNVIDQ